MNCLSEIVEVKDVPLTSTFIEDNERCPRYAHFRHCAGLVTKGATPEALARGTLLHKIVAQVLEGVPLIDAESAATRLLEEQVQAVVESLDSSGYTPGGLTADEAIKAIAGNVKVAIAMARAYVKFFGISYHTLDILTDGGDGTLHRKPYDVYPGSVEHPIAWDYGDYSETGTLDCVVMDHAKKQFWVVDHKTCGIDLIAYARTLPLTPQSLVYPGLASDFCKGSDWTVAGTIYNVIHTPGIRCCAKDGNNIYNYAKRVDDWYNKNPSAVMLQVQVPYRGYRSTSEEVRIERVLPFVHGGSLPLDVIPATGGKACTTFNRPCAFLDMCTSDRTLWKDMIDRRFRQEWRYADSNGATDTED